MTPPLAHADLMTLGLPELRRRMAEHKAARPEDPFSRGMAPWMADKAALAFAIERKEGEAASPPFFITVPPQPMEGLRVQPELDFTAMTPTRRHVRPEPIPDSDEVPMPTKNPPRAAGDPQERLAQLMERLARNYAAKNAGAAYVTRADIRKHCGAHGLEVPEAARKRSVPPPTAAQRPKLPKVKEIDSTAPAPATATHGTATPVASAEQRATTPRARSVAHLVAKGAAQSAVPTPSARIRALRSQALDILPELEDLTPEQAREVLTELSLLSETLVLGSHLSERSA